jgi:hypothetical protein
MIQYIIAILLLALLHLFYKFIYKPKKLFNFYVDNLKALGYKAKVVPFKPFQVPIITQCLKGYKQHNDAFYFDKR